jgi:uncharacterized protein with PIN domain
MGDAEIVSIGAPTLVECVVVMGRADGMTYATARSADRPLLYTGDDFAQTAGDDFAQTDIQAA